jgi:hypothetical protein
MRELEQLEGGVLGVVGHALGKVLRNGLIGLLVGVGGGEVLGIVLDRAPGLHAPNLFVHVVSGVLGVVLAFGVAMTTALTEAIQAALTALRAVGGEAKQAVGTSLRDVGQVVDSVEHRAEHAAGQQP